MKKLIIIIALSAALLSLYVSMVGISWFSIRQIGFSGETFRLVSVGAEATEEKILGVNGPSTLEVRIFYGNIRSAIPVTLSGDLEEQHSVGSINGGGESLTASTKSGNIRIEVINP